MAFMHFNRRLTSVAAALAILATAPSTSAGEVGAGILGGVIGGVVGSAITNSVNNSRQRQQQTVVREREVIVHRERPRTRTVYVDRTPSIDPYTRAENRRTQQALNYFGFNAGAPDGVVGARTRRAVQSYQTYMNFPVTGYLTPQEQGFLVTSYDRALAGGPNTMQIVAGDPNGVRAILPHYWSGQTAPVAPQVQPQPQQPANQITINVPQQQAVAAAQPEAAAPAAPAAAPAQTQTASAEAAPAAPSGALPMFVAGPIEASMSSFCARVAAPSPLPGVDVQNAALSAEGESVLASQFCAARGQALVESDRIAATIQGVTRGEMQKQCEAFAPSMDKYVATLVSEGAPAAKSALQAYVVGTGIPMQALAANSRICLGIGYGADNARVTLASSMILVGIGEVGFGEVLGYHLAYGFGAPENRARAADWLEDASSALRSGARPVVADASPDRPQLLQAMAARLRGAPAQALAPAQPQDVSAPPAAGGFQMPGAEPEPKKQL
ncbi:peptidoglycan-binding protein [Pikeienuella piscinae]|uniref:Peptidoglycan-binding protein n=1 Tax=Pikeienuella piscinae TaxID=2748098 RepID=A0A7L5BV54_9RHOB|nr:peptidoglycan-binding domain-containing protein [Pikeienuella piscinae]QIE55231.1 peptidoglycan-binding protein [Pikeienuella piscinae]